MSELDADTKEAWDYLLEVIVDYERYVRSIGELGLAAPNVLYYRDEIQEGLQEFKLDPRVDFKSAWLKVKELDELLRQQAATLVREIGHANFKQYQIINDPPKANWWWWLNRVVKAPTPPPPVWQFWKARPAEEKLLAPEPSDAETTSGSQEAGD